MRFCSCSKDLEWGLSEASMDPASPHSPHMLSKKGTRLKSPSHLSNNTSPSFSYHSTYSYPFPGLPTCFAPST